MPLHNWDIITKSISIQSNLFSCLFIQVEDSDSSKDDRESPGKCQNKGSVPQYFSRPSSDSYSLEQFFTYHPQQKPKNLSLQRLFSCRDGTNRKWLTYCEENHTLYCTVCLAFAKPGETSPFISGMQDWKHISQRVQEHERSNMHRVCAEAYF